MKAKILLAAVMTAVTLSAAAQVHVSGYTKKDGAYVAPHERTAPNRTTFDNYSTKGNLNPYTGIAGTKDPTPSPYTYQSPQRAQERTSLGYPSTQSTKSSSRSPSNPFAEPAKRY